MRYMMSLPDSVGILLRRQVKPQFSSQVACTLHFHRREAGFVSFFTISSPRT